MKISPAKRAKGFAITIADTGIKGINMLITTVNLVIQFSPLLLIGVKFLARLPRRTLELSEGVRKIGFYEFTDGRGGMVQILLADALMQDALGTKVPTQREIEQPVLGSSTVSRQSVLGLLRERVAVDRSPHFEVPEAPYLWNHPGKGFRKIERLRNASAAEKRDYRHLLRHAVGHYVDYVRNA